ncbi:MAG: A/G-specific adenine glycosylase [Patescibacteria group bacterium]
MDYSTFQREVWKFYREHARDLPWRKSITPYKILVSEIMLQQTQVDRVQEKFRVFIKAFPTFRHLAMADTHSVLALWQGLGYNRRALSLQKSAKEITLRHKGKIPKTVEELVSLPGIGPATAGAILAYAFNDAQPFIETNIRRVYLHHFFPMETNVSDQKILRIIEQTIDRKNPREWHWALMDYGSHLGKIMRRENPNRRSRHYTKQAAFTGSNRQVRGKIIKALIASPTLPVVKLSITTKTPKKRILGALEGLIRDGLVAKKGTFISLIGKS